MADTGYRRLAARLDSARSGVVSASVWVCAVVVPARQQVRGCTACDVQDRRRRKTGVLRRKGKGGYAPSHVH